MKESTPREKILKAVRDALVVPMDAVYQPEEFADRIYAPAASDYHEVTFAESLTKVNGKFVYNSHVQELGQNLKHLLQNFTQETIHCYEPALQKVLNEHGLFCINAREEFEDCQLGITSCEFLLARTGSVMISSRQPYGRKGVIWPPVHLIIAWRSQLVYDFQDAMKALKAKYLPGPLPSMISLITGPSRTADIEKTLVMGAHGPKELFVFFVDE